MPITTGWPAQGGEKCDPKEISINFHRPLATEGAVCYHTRMELYFYMGIEFLLSIAEAALFATGAIAFLMWLEGAPYTDPY